MNRYSGIWRSAAAALFALLMAVRLLSPAGFMPAFEHGAVSIVACPDGDPAPTPMAHHHHGDPKLQQHCPYAAGSAPATAADVAAVAAVLVAAALLLAGQPLQSFQRRRQRERPPLRGPPTRA